MNAGQAVVFAAFGAILGSFANVVIYRLPRDESVVVPGSRCPSCQVPIRARDNVPVLSFLLLRGRCRSCGAPISTRYPLVEALMAALAVAVRLRVPPLGGGGAAADLGLLVAWLPLVSALLFTFLLVVITFIDLDHQLILNRLTYPGIVAGLALGAAQGRAVPALIAGVAAAAVILIIVIASRGGMGLGDVKLAALIGVFLASPAQTAVALFMGFIAGGVVGIVLLALRLRGRKDAIPFGPFLAVGALGALFWGERIALWYWPL